MGNENIAEYYAEKEKLDYSNLNFTQSKIVRILWKHKEMPRDIICEEIGISRTTVYDNMHSINGGMVKRGILTHKMVNNGKRGRPTKMWLLTDKFIKAMEGELKNG